MPRIELPDRGQPLDISYLYRIVSEINNVSSLIGNTLSKIKYKNSTSAASPLTSNLVFYAETVKAPDANLSTGPNTPVTFTYSGIFKTAPIVLCSVATLDGVSNIYGVLKNVGQSSCDVNIYSPATAGVVSAEVSILAIGERINS